MASTVLDASPVLGLPIAVSQICDSTDVPRFPLRKFSVAEYESLAHYGILGEDDKVELLEGWVVEKMTKNHAHEQALYRLARALERQLPAGYLLRNQSLVITGDSVPEPDLMLVRGLIEDFDNRLTNAREVELVIEIADSSLSIDRRKCLLYACAGIHTYWIVNLPKRCIEVYSDPAGIGSTGYSSRSDVMPHDTVLVRLSESLTFSLAVSEFLPQRIS